MSDPAEAVGGTVMTRRRFHGRLLLVVAAAAGLSLTVGLALAQAVHEEPARRLASAQPAQQFNELEIRIVDALGRMGLHGERAPVHGPDGADIRVIFPDGTDTLTINASPHERRPGDYVVVGERVIEGVVVQSIRFVSGATTDQFECEDGVRFD